MRRALAVLVVCLSARIAGAVEITILHTSDLHGRVSPVDALENRDLGGGLARVAAAVKAIRAEGHPVLLLDSGDTIQGAPEQALTFAADPTAKDPIVAAMNLAGYDAMAIGNHEFDFGRARLAASERQATFPMLSGNTLAQDGSDAFKPYVVRIVGGARVGILGLVNSQAAATQWPANLGGARFTEPMFAARRWVPILREKERCDVVIVIAHLGFEKDPKTGEPAETAQGNRAWALASEVPGIDFVLAGHNHVVVEPRKIGNAWVSEPGRWGANLTRFDVKLEKTPEGTWKIVQVDGRTLAMAKQEPDAEIVSAVAASHAAARKALGTRLADLTAAVPASDRKDADSPLVDWIHRVERHKGSATLSFASLLGFESPPAWPAGPVTLRQLWQIYPYENMLVTVKATGKIVREALERAAACLADPAARARDCDSLEGAEYELDLSRPAGRRVVFLRRNGKDIGDADELTVALNSHRAAGGGGYRMWRRAQPLREGGNIRDLLAADARSAGILTLPASGNWKVTGP